MCSRSSSHDGVHPRLGVVDVVPFVALDVAERPVARQLRDATARWIAHTFDVAAFLYGALGDGTTAFAARRAPSRL